MPPALHQGSSAPGIRSANRWAMARKPVLPDSRCRSLAVPNPIQVFKPELCCKWFRGFGRWFGGPPDRGSRPAEGKFRDLAGYSLCLNNSKPRFYGHVAHYQAAEVSDQAHPLDSTRRSGANHVDNRLLLDSGYWRFEYRVTATCHFIRLWGRKP